MYLMYNLYVSVLCHFIQACSQFVSDMLNNQIINKKPSIQLLESCIHEVMMLYISDFQNEQLQALFEV